MGTTTTDEVRPLLHVGFPKTASTWLQRFVFQRDGAGLFEDCDRQLLRREIIGANPLWYDASGVRRHVEERDQEARGPGLVPVVSHELLVGHPVSGGHNATTIAERLKELFPHARVVIVIREQRQRLLSLYKQYVRGGGPGTLRRYLHPLGVARRPVFDFRYLEYDRVLAHYRMLFGPEHVRVLLFEGFRADRLGFCRDLLEFAGAPPMLEVPSARVNAGLSSFTAGLLGRTNSFFRRDDRVPRLVRVLERVDRFVPGALAGWSAGRMQALLEYEVGDRYLGSNRRTRELTGRDLADRGYRLDSPAP